LRFNIFFFFAYNKYIFRPQATKMDAKMSMNIAVACSAVALIGAGVGSMGHFADPSTMPYVKTTGTMPVGGGVNAQVTTYAHFNQIEVEMVTPVGTTKSPPTDMTGECADQSTMNTTFMFVMLGSGVGALAASFLRKGGDASDSLKYTALATCLLGVVSGVMIMIMYNANCETPAGFETSYAGAWWAFNGAALMFLIAGIMNFMVSDASAAANMATEVVAPFDSEA